MRRDVSDDLTDALIQHMAQDDDDGPLPIVENAELRPLRTESDLTHLLADGLDAVPLREGANRDDDDDASADDDDEDDDADDADDDIDDEHVADLLEREPDLRAELLDDIETAAKFIEWGGARYAVWKERYA